jgi:hypothetical protein
MPKQMRRVDSHAYLDFEQKLPQLIEHPQTLLLQYGPDAEIDSYYDYDDTRCYGLYYYWEETDKEAADREAEEAESARTREAHERRAYETLKAKFEKGT